MADASRKFEVKIVSSYESEGSKQAAQGFEQVGEAGKKSGESIFESHREVHKLLHTIGNDAIPGMGQALGALAHGPLGAIIAVGLAVEFVKKNIEETNKKLDEMSATASKAFGGGDSLTDYVKSLAEAASQTDALAEAIKKASNAGSEVTNRYKSEAAAIHEVVEALKAKLKAEGKDVPTGALDDAEAQARQQARTRELAERQGNQDPLNTAAAATLTPANVIQTRSGRAAELSAQQAALAKATSEMNTEANDNILEEIEAKKESLEFSRKAYGDSDPLGLMKKTQDEVDRLESESAQGRAEAAKKKIEQLSEQIARDTENAAKEKAAREAATAAATENARRVVELQKEIESANIAAKIKTESVSQLITDLHPDAKTLERVAGVDTDAGSASFIQKFLESQARLSHQQGTADDSQLTQLLNQVLQTTQQKDRRSFLLLQDLIRHNGNLEAALADLARQMGNRPVMRGSVTGQ